MVYLPLRMLAANGPPAGATLADVLVALRCRRCGQAPVSAALIEDPADNASGRMGAAPGWRVVLVEGSVQGPVGVPKAAPESSRGDVREWECPVAVRAASIVSVGRRAEMRAMMDCFRRVLVSSK